MRASGGRTTAGFCLKKDKTRLQLFTGANSQSPLLPLSSCPLSSPPPVLAGPVMTGKNGIRAARCLSEASLRGPPFFLGSAGCPKRSAGTQTAGRLFFAYFLLAKQKKVSRRRATPGQQLSAKPTTEASK